MKKTLTINISGTVFHIDEDAYEKLNNYLYEINRHFRSDNDAKEILEDIEARISELFRERIKGANDVVTISHVDEIIEIMGSPSAFSSLDEEPVEEEPRRKIQRGKAKKLYRDPDDRILGGVCSGLGAYFNVDPLVFRLIFVITFFIPVGSFLVYLILWIVVPRAKTAAQRLEMKGEEVNINNISKSIKEEFQDVKDNYKRFRSSNSYSKGEERAREVGNVFLQILGIIAKVLIITLGVILVIAGITAVVALFGSLFITHEFIGITPWNTGVPHYLDLFVDGRILNWFWIGIALVIGIPLIMLIFLGTKMIFRFKSNNAFVGPIAAGLWLLGIVLLIITAGKGLSNFKSTSTATSQESIVTKSDTLYLALGQDEFKDFYDTNFAMGNMKVAAINGKEFLLGAPRLEIERTDAQEFNLVIKNRSRGGDLNKAQQHAREIKYKFEAKDSILTFQPWFMVPENSTWKGQEVSVILKVPANKTIYINENLDHLLNDVENTSNTWDHDMGGKYWTMKPEGLTMAEKALPQPETSKKNKK